MNWSFLAGWEVRSSKPPDCSVTTVKVIAKDIFGLDDPYESLPTSDILYSTIFKIFAFTLLALVAIAGLVAHNKIVWRNKGVRHFTLYPVQLHVLLADVRQ